VCAEKFKGHGYKADEWLEKVVCSVAFRSGRLAWQHIGWRKLRVVLSMAGIMVDYEMQ
jgi:hypothetical protein